MADYLQYLDRSVFYFVNKSLQNSVLDFFMPFITDLNKQKVILVTVAVLLILLMVKGGKRGIFAVVALAVGILFSDQLNSSVAKFLLERPRPCHVLQNVHLLVSCGSGYSFPSSHAVNNLCGAVIVAFFFPRAAGWLFSFAAIVCFSRVYVGVHYPSDVLGGAVIGITCGLVIVALFLWSEHFALTHLRQRQGPVIEDR
jgi:undecaprenyl-diphosphatase